MSHAPDGGYSANGTLNVPLIQGQVSLRVSAFSAFEPGYFTREWGYVTSPPVPLPPDAPTGEKNGMAAAQKTGAMASLAIAPAAVAGADGHPDVHLPALDLQRLSARRFFAEQSFADPAIECSRGG